MWVLIANLNTMGPTLCQAMSEPNFWHGMRSKKAKIFTIRKNCWPEAWTMLIYWDIHAVRLEFFFLKLVKLGPFRQSLTISSICNKVFRTIFLKPDTVGIIPRSYRMGDRQSAEDFQCLAYIGWKRDDEIHAGNGREVHLPGVPNVKVDGYSPKTQEVFEYLRCSWHGCLCIPNRHKPIGNTEEILLSRYEETAGLKKIENAGYKVVSIWGVSLGNCCAKIQALKMYLVRTLTLRTLHLIFVLPCTGVELMPQKHITESSRRRKSTTWI